MVKCPKCGKDVDKLTWMEMCHGCTLRAQAIVKAPKPLEKKAEFERKLLASREKPKEEVKAEKEEGKPKEEGKLKGKIVGFFKKRGKVAASALKKGYIKKWRCKDCGYVWIGEKTNCPKCNSPNIGSAYTATGIGILFKFIGFSVATLMILFTYFSQLLGAIYSATGIPALPPVIIILVGLGIAVWLALKPLGKGMVFLVIFFILGFIPTMILPVYKDMTIPGWEIPVDIFCIFKNIFNPEGMQACYMLNKDKIEPTPTRKLIQFSVDIPSKVYAGTLFTTETTIDLLEKNEKVEDIEIEVERVVNETGKMVGEYLTMCPEKEIECLNTKTLPPEFVWWYYKCDGNNPDCNCAPSSCNLDKVNDFKKVLIWWNISCDIPAKKEIGPTGEEVKRETKLDFSFRGRYKFDAKKNYKVIISRVETEPPKQEETMVGPVSLGVSTTKNDIYRLDGIKKGIFKIKIFNLGSGTVKVKREIKINQMHDPSVSSFNFIQCSFTERIETSGPPGDKTITLVLETEPEIYSGKDTMINCVTEIPQDVKIWNEYLFKINLPYTYSEQIGKLSTTVDFSTC